MRLSVGADSRFFISVEPLKMFTSRKLFKLRAGHAGILCGFLGVNPIYYVFHVAMSQIDCHNAYKVIACPEVPNIAKPKRRLQNLKATQNTNGKSWTEL